MIQVQVLVQQHRTFDTNLFTKIKVPSFTIEALQEAYPSEGEITFTSPNTIIVEDEVLDLRTIYVKQMFVK